MKKLILLFLIVPIFAMGQNFQSHARVFLQKGISVTESSWLDFSNVTVTGAGELIVNTDGTSSITGLIASRGTVSPAVLSITGMPNTYFVVSLPTNIQITSGASILYVNSFVCNFPNKVGKTDSNGKADLIIGGRLQIPEAVTFGEHTGVINLVINYQ